MNAVGYKLAMQTDKRVKIRQATDLCTETRWRLYVRCWHGGIWRRYHLYRFANLALLPLRLSNYDRASNILINHPVC